MSTEAVLKGGNIMKGALITMTAVTGKPARARVYEYMKGISDNGIYQVMLYPRSGCELEYLSTEWFDAITCFIEAASELNMSIWLYDDFNWPSGDACGRVSAIERYRLKSIKISGDGIGKISRTSSHNKDLFGEKYFPDLLLPEAVDYFIECTHEQYYKKYRSYFGNVIKGIFTDEPSIGYCCNGESLPYYDGLADDYAAAYGRDMYKDIYSKYHDLCENVMSLISDRFKCSYIDRIAAWCNDHGILMAGHLMCDNDPFHATKHSGKFLKNLSAFSLPGIDEIETSFADDSIMTLLGAIEYASGKNGAMAELFALGPCDMTYAKRKCMLYLCACHKVDHYFLAVSHLDMRGNLLVTDYFNNFNTDQPDFCGMKLLANDAKAAAEYAKEDYTPDIYIRYPYRVAAKRVSSPPERYVITKLTEELTYRQIQWKFIDDETIDNVPVIELTDELELTVGGNLLDIDKIKHTPILTDKKGDTPRGIFVRRFDSGRVIIINLFAPEGEYYVNGCLVYIKEHDVILSIPKKLVKKEKIDTVFDISYKNPNLIRAMHLNSQKISHIYCDSDTSATFFVRNGEEVSINGEKTECLRNADALSDGMRDLYKMSRDVSLKAGLNIIETQNDLKYMPSVFIMGEFAYTKKSSDICALYLKKRNYKYAPGDILSYYGGIELTAEVTVPHGISAIELTGCSLYTRLYCDGELMGESIASPYIYKIGKELYGKTITIKIEQYSSIGPIFGDTEYWDKNAAYSQWHGTPSTKETLFGFLSISWVY